MPNKLPAADSFVKFPDLLPREVVCRAAELRCLRKSELVPRGAYMVLELLNDAGHVIWSHVAACRLAVTFHVDGFLKRVSTQESAFICRQNFARPSRVTWPRVASAHAKLNFSMPRSCSILDPSFPRIEIVRWLSHASRVGSFIEYRTWVTSTLITA